MLNWFKPRDTKQSTKPPRGPNRVPNEMTQVRKKTSFELHQETQIKLQSLLADCFLLSDDFNSLIRIEITELVSSLQSDAIAFINWEHSIVLEQGNVITSVIGQVVFHACQGEKWAQELTNRVILEGNAADIDWNYKRLFYLKTDMTIFSRIVFYASKNELWAIIALDSLFKTVALSKLDFNAEIIDSTLHVTPLHLLVQLAGLGHPQYLIKVLTVHQSEMGSLMFNIKIMGNALLDILFDNKCQHLVTWIYLANLRIETSYLKPGCTFFIRNIEGKIKNVAEKMWHFRQVQYDLPEEKYQEIYYFIAYDCLKADLKDIPKSEHSRIIAQALNKHFYFQPRDEEEKEWKRITSDHDACYEKRAKTFLVKLAARKVYQETPINNPNLPKYSKKNPKKPYLIELVQERVTASLEELQNKKIIPSFIDCAHRTAIIDELAKRRELTQGEIMEVIKSKYALKKAKPK